MARSTSSDDPEAAAPDPDFEVPEPARASSYTPSFVLQAVMELQRSHGDLTRAAAEHSARVERQEAQLGKIDDIRVDVARLDTRLVSVEAELKSAKDKLDQIRNWIVGAAAIVGAATVITPIAIHFWPGQQNAPAAAPAAPAQSSAPR